MQRFKKINELKDKRVHMALGQFDGVHIGHQALLQRCLDSAKQAGRPSCVFTFATTPHPDKEKVLGKSLMTIEEKLGFFEKMGFDCTLMMPFDDEIRLTPKKEFLDMLAVENRVEAVYCGEDFRFGFMGQGDVDFLKKYCRQSGTMQAVVVPTVSLFGKAVSSTRIRAALLQHEDQLASALLGREYREEDGGK